MLMLVNKFLFQFENPNTASENWHTAYAANQKINKAYSQLVSNGVWNYWGSQTTMFQIVFQADTIGHHVHLARLVVLV